MSKFNKTQIAAIATKLDSNKEFHRYPKAQHTKVKSTKAESNVDLIGAIKAGADIGWIDIAPAGLPKACFKSLMEAFGQTYNPYVGKHLNVVDRFFVTSKHIEAEQKGIALITFDTAVKQIVSSKDKVVQKWMESEQGQVFQNKLEQFLTKSEETKSAKTESVQTQIDMNWLKK